MPAVDGWTVMDGWTAEGKPYFSRFFATSILNGELPHPLLGQLAEVSNEPPAIKRKGTSEFLKTLRDLTDQWIQSGRRDGVEEAWTRNTRWKPPTGAAPIFDVLSDYRDRNPPQVEPRDDGGFNVWMLPASPNSKHLLLRVRDAATYTFISLLNSPAQRRISKCDFCRTYFVRARAPKRNMPIFRGSYCEKCKGEGSARRTAETRDRREREKVEWAADAWARWKPTNRYGRQSDWVVRQMNARLGLGRHIKGNWVTRHKKAIEAEIERRKHAKG